MQRSKGPEDQDISNSNSNTSLTLKNVHLIFTFIYKVVRQVALFTSLLVQDEDLNKLFESDCKIEV